MRWIKYDVTLPYKPAILAAMEDCSRSNDAVVGAFLRLYAWFDEMTADGFLPRVSHQLVDARAGIPGFAASLERSGWLAFDGRGCTVANWDEHNGHSAKRRAMDAKLKNETRERMRRAGLPVRPLPQNRKTTQQTDET